MEDWRIAKIAVIAKTIYCRLLSVSAILAITSFGSLFCFFCSSVFQRFYRPLAGLASTLLPSSKNVTAPKVSVR